jgi:hypothetical protein
VARVGGTGQGDVRRGSLRWCHSIKMAVGGVLARATVLAAAGEVIHLQKREGRCEAPRN